MVYIYLQLFYYYLNLDVPKKSLLAGGVFRCPSGLSCSRYLRDTTVTIIYGLSSSSARNFKLYTSALVEKNI